MGEWTKFWSQIDAMKKEHDTTRDTINRRRGWKFKGCEVFGIRTRWRAEFQESASDMLQEVEKPTSGELLAEVARISELCPKCFHRLSVCGEKGCSINRGGNKCGCEHSKKAAMSEARAAP